MSQSLDVYREWLGITDGLRPPDHYTLLGVPRGESDVGRINSAADARLKVVRPRCLKFPEQGTQLLNEIALARLCLTDDEERATYDSDLLTTSTQDVQQWAKIHATFEDSSVESAQYAEAVALTAEPIATSAPAEVQPETYSVSAPATAAPTNSDDSTHPPPTAESNTAATKKARWCPHCGTRLLPAATFCYSCSLAEISTSHRMQMKCRACDKRQPTGMVVCRKCKHDHALRGAQPKMPKGLLDTPPYYVADHQSGKPETAENEPIDLAEINPNLSDDDFAKALTEEVGDQSENAIHIKSRARELAEKKARKEAEKKAEEEAAIENRPALVSLWYDLVEYSQEHPVFMKTTVSIAILAVFCTPLFFLRSGPRKDARSSPAPLPRMMPVPAGELQAAADSPNQPKSTLKPPEATDTLATSVPEPSPPAATRFEGVFGEALAALDDTRSDSKTLLKHRDIVLSHPTSGLERGRFEGLADRLLKEAESRADSEHRDAINLANDNDDFQKIWKQVREQESGRPSRSKSEHRLQKDLTDAWYRFHTTRIQTRIEGLFDLDQIAEALQLRDELLPPELREDYSQQWTTFIDKLLKSKLQAHNRKIDTVVKKRVAEGEYLSALDYLDETLSQHSKPPSELAEFVEKLRKTVLASAAQGGIRQLINQSRFEQAQPLVELLLQHPTHDTAARRFRQEMIRLNAWTGTPPIVVAAENAVRTNVKDPPQDYEADKSIVRLKLKNAGERRLYDEWYRKLNRFKHKAGFFVLIKGHQLTIVEGLADAAYEAFRLDAAPDLGGKKTPIKSDWFGTLDEARQAYPDAL